jgi:acyl-homoserine lactone acylase PvdQ
MVKLLEDTKDLFAEHKKNNMIGAVNQYLALNPGLKNVTLQGYLSKIDKWNSHFDADQTEPTLFSAWEYFIFRDILKTQLPDQTIKLKILGNSIIQTFFMNLFESVNEDLNYKTEYCDGSCALLFWTSLKEAVEFLVETYGSVDQEWGKVFNNHYTHNPFGQTPLKYFFDKKSPAVGNLNSVNMVSYSVEDFEENPFYGTFSGNLIKHFEY